MNINDQEYVIKHVELPSLGQLEKDWRELEARSDASFFTSWSWIGCWLSCLPSHIHPKLLRVTRGNEIVGLGLLVSRDFWRHRIFPVKALFLHATGDPLFDQITIEYNGFLVDRRLQTELVPQIYEHLVTMSTDWDELHLDGIVQSSLPQLAQSNGLKIVRRQEFSNYVDLDEVRFFGGDYLSMLGSGTRYNIRRSIKEFEKIGHVTLSVASNLEEAVQFMKGLKHLHQVRWASKGIDGAFGNKFLEFFHLKLIENRFYTGEIQLIMVRAGDRVVGYLYNLVYFGIIHNYQSGFDYSICKSQYSPGLVVHFLAIEYNMSQGHRSYDLMAGNSQYKQAICKHSQKMDWVVLQRDRIKFRIENRMRMLKYKLRAIVELIH